MKKGVYLMVYVLIICIIALIITIVAKIRESKSDGINTISYSRDSSDNSLHELKKPINHENMTTEEKVSNYNNDLYERRVTGPKKENDYKSSATDNIVVDDELKEKIIELKNSGKTIHAIKTLRDATKMSLADAKNYVEKL